MGVGRDGPALRPRKLAQPQTTAHNNHNLVRLPSNESHLANTIEKDDATLTKRALKDSIPKELFNRSYTKSLAHLAIDLLIVAVAWLAMRALVTAAPSLAPIALPAYWFYQGLSLTALWVIAHECGHGGFTDSKRLNDCVGFVLHSALVTPYFSWAITHAKHHHYTNHMTEGETWVPSTANPNKKSVRYAKSFAGTWQRILSVALVGWYTYLFVNATGARQNLGQSHFSPSSRALFKPKDRVYVLASNAGCLLTLAVLAACVQKWGFAVVFTNYLVPQTICNFYLCAITFMQHTHVDVPHFDGDDWTWLRGALSTIDRSMGSWVDAKLHHIVDSHVVHHIFSDMPFYGAKAATPYVKEKLGKYYKSHFGTKVAGSEYLGYWSDFYSSMRDSVTTQKGSDGYYWFS